MQRFALGWSFDAKQTMLLSRCPFASKPSLSRKGKQRMQYILADKGPRMQALSFTLLSVSYALFAALWCCLPCRLTLDPGVLRVMM